MSRLQLTRDKLIYSNPEMCVKVYTGVIAFPQHVEVVIKEQVYSTLESANRVIQEALTMATLDHPAIVKIYDCALELENQTFFKSILVMEQMERDLEEEIKQRKNEGRPWTDAELMNHLRRLVSALSMAEAKGISHRDIKPQNILLSRGQLKLGDFGACTRQLLFGHLSSTLQGSPFYLSPELKREYVRYVQEGVLDLHYDAVKSDVYSLGVTILYMALLKEPMELTFLDRLEEGTRALVRSLSEFPNIQQQVSWMLTEKPDERPTFQTMDYYFSYYQAYYDQLIYGKEVQPPAAEEVKVEEVNCAPAQLEEGRLEAVDCAPAQHEEVMAEEVDCAAALLEEAKIEEVKCEAPQPEEAKEAAPVPSVVRFSQWSHRPQGPLAMGGEPARPVSLPVASIQVCCICGKQVEGQLRMRLPSRHAQEIANNCCSEACLDKLTTLLQGENCVYCHEEVARTSRVDLLCGHKFHSKDCLFDYMKECNPLFDYSFKYKCPNCRIEISFENVIRLAFRKGELDRRIQGAPKLPCSYCEDNIATKLVDGGFPCCSDCFFEYYGGPVEFFVEFQL